MLCVTHLFERDPRAKRQAGFTVTPPMVTCRSLRGIQPCRPVRLQSPGLGRAPHLPVSSQWARTVAAPAGRAGTISRSAASAEKRGAIVSSREVILIQQSLAANFLA